MAVRVSTYTPDPDIDRASKTGRRRELYTDLDTMYAAGYKTFVLPRWLSRNHMIKIIVDLASRLNPDEPGKVVNASFRRVSDICNGRHRRIYRKVYRDMITDSIATRRPDPLAKISPISV